MSNHTLPHGIGAEDRPAVGAAPTDHFRVLVKGPKVRTNTKILGEGSTSVHPSAKLPRTKR